MRELIIHIIREEVDIKTRADEFIKKAKEIHGEKYDYSNVDYKNAKTKVSINCPKHGLFPQTPSSHLNGNGCKFCAIEDNSKKRLIPVDTFISRAKDIHGIKYDYSETIYNGYHKPLNIICPKHGIFPQTPREHLSGNGCPKCAGKNKTTDEVIKDFIKVHGNTYDYSKVNFINNNTDVIITCQEHGDFQLDPGHHLMGVGCRKCSGRGLTNDEWIQRAKDVHGNKYDYSKFNFEKAINKTIVICPKHGEWSTTPNDHINRGSGCPTCKESKGEKQVVDILNRLNLHFVRQKKYNDCKGTTSKFCKKLPFDFYLPDINTLIEYDGRQHYEPVYGEEQLIIQQRIDNIKNQYSLTNNIRLIRIPYTIKFSDMESFIKKELGITS